MDRFEELSKADRFEQLAAQATEQPAKPSLSLGKTIMNEAEDFLSLPMRGTFDMLSAMAGGVLYPASKAANYGTAAYGKITGDPNWKENAYQAETTVQGLNPFQYAQQKLGIQPTPQLQQGAELFGYASKPSEYVKENYGYLPGEAAEQITNYAMGRPVLKSKFGQPDSVPFQGTMAEGLKLRPSASKKSALATGTELIGDLPLIREYTNRIRRPINETVVDALDEVGNKLKDQSDIRKFQEQKSTLYSNAWKSLPDKPVQLPNVVQYLQDNLANNKKLSANSQATIIKLLADEKKNNGFTKAAIENMTAEKGLKAIRKPLQNVIIDDIEPISPDAVKAFRDVNKEYRYTSKSEAFNNFRKEVTIGVGSEEIIDPVKWRRNYDRLRKNAQGYHKDLIKQLDKIDELVNIAKDDLGSYKEWKAGQGKMLERGAGLLLGGSSLFPLTSGIIGPYGAGIGAGALAGTILTKSAYNPKGIINKALTGRTGELVPFELKAITNKMKRK
jgi:hypothetical protein